MISKIKRSEVFRKSVTISAAGQTVVDVPPDNMPGGLIHGFEVRLESADLTGLGAAASDYPKVLNSITYGAQNPKFNVMTAVSGKLWDKIYTTLMRKATTRTTPVAGGFVITYYLPFSWLGTDKKPAFRRKDTCLLNVANKALPFLNLILGPKTDIGTTITGSPDVIVSIHAVYEPEPRAGLYNPVNEALSGDQPGRMLEITAKQKADLSSNGIAQLTTGGPRECIGVVLRELNAGTEVSDIFNVGVATPSKLEFVKGDSDNYTPRVKVVNLDAVMSDELGVAIPAGYHFWIAAAEGRLSDCVDLRDGAPFSMVFDNLANSASRQLEIVQMNTLDLSEEQKAVHADWLKK